MCKRNVMFVCVYVSCALVFLFFFFNDTATTEIYTLSLHDALPISASKDDLRSENRRHPHGSRRVQPRPQDRKSTRLNSSHLVISYAVFCLKKKKHTPMSSTKIVALPLDN